MSNDVKCADAKIIVNGFAFYDDSLGFKVKNIYDDKKETIISNDGEILVTNMNDIEIDIIKDYLKKDEELLKEAA